MLIIPNYIHYQSLIKILWNLILLSQIKSGQRLPEKIERASKFHYSSFQPSFFVLFYYNEYYLIDTGIFIQELNNFLKENINQYNQPITHKDIKNIIKDLNFIFKKTKIKTHAI